MMTLRLPSAVVVALAASVAAGYAQAPSKPATDVTGQWTLTFTTPQGGRDVQTTFKQSGEKLTGALSGQAGEMALEGTVKENAIAFGFSFDTPNGSMRIAISGTVAGDSMKGTADMGEMGQTDWTAARAAKAPSPPPAASAAAVDVTGEWAFEVQTDAGSGSPTLTFKQTGEALTGRYKGQYGEAPLTGTVKGTAISFSYLLEAQGASVTLVYSGTVEKNSMKGSVTLGELGQGSFSGKRK